jgi:predicted nucleic acid-binding protein
MSTFADSSAIVKLYADESGREHVTSLELLVISQLARVEVPAAIWRKQRMGELSPADARLLADEFEADYFGTPDSEPRFAAVLPTAALLDEAARMVAVHGLRAYDAVQLSSGRAARAADPECTTFAVCDSDLRIAALAEGFQVVSG